MARTSLNLPQRLKDEAEQWASRQGVSLNQFIAWAVAEKVGGLKQAFDDPRFPQVTFRTGASGWPTPVLRGTGIRIQTIAHAAHGWNLGEKAIAEDYGLTPAQVREALAFYQAHRGEIDAVMAEERRLEQAGA